MYGNAVKVVSWDSCICIHQVAVNWHVSSYLADKLKLIMAATEPTWTPMEALFRTTNNAPGRAVELLPGLTTDDILVAGVPWKIFCYFLHVVESVWITETKCISLNSSCSRLSSWWFSIGNPKSASVKVGFSPNSLGPAVATIDFVSPPLDKH
jgi:hypothetical protein